MEPHTAFAGFCPRLLSSYTEILLLLPAEPPHQQLYGDVPLPQLGPGHLQLCLQQLHLLQLGGQGLCGLEQLSVNIILLVKLCPKNMVMVQLLNLRISYQSIIDFYLGFGSPPSYPLGLD